MTKDPIRCQRIIMVCKEYGWRLETTSPGREMKFRSVDWLQLVLPCLSLNYLHFVLSLSLFWESPVSV